MESCRRLGEKWCRNKPNVTMPKRRDVPTSQLHNVAKSQRRDVVGKSQQTLSLGEAIKGMGESNCGGSKFFCRVRVGELGVWNKGKKT